jgi:hypothetical protein
LARSAKKGLITQPRDTAKRARRTAAAAFAKVHGLLTKIIAGYDHGHPVAARRTGNLAV